MSRRLYLFLPALCALLGASACPRKEARPAEPPAPASAVLFVSADLWGYLGPCGCSENMRGGIARAAFQVAEARKKGTPVLYIDGGDTLFTRADLPEAQIPQEERKAKALAQALKQMGVATWSPGERDDVRGADFRKALFLPEQAGGTARVFDVGPRRVGVVTGRSEGELELGAQSARQLGAEFVVGLYHQSVEAAQKAASAAGLGVDLIVATHAAGEFSAEENRLARTGIPVAQVQSKGRSLLRVDLSFAATAGKFELLKTQADLERDLSALDERIALLTRQLNEPGLREETRKVYLEKIQELTQRRQTLATATLPPTEGRNAFAVRFIPLESTLPGQPETKALVDAFDRDVAVLNLEWARKNGKDCPPPKKGEAAYVGNARCRECHAEAFPVWEGSKHAHAYATLEQAGKQYNLDCVRCHVVATDKPGGVCRVDKVEERAYVGCESCHGPGSIHAEDPTVQNVLAKPAQEQCVHCHERENSPHFNFATYLPQILGKGHGAKTPGK